MFITANSEKRDGLIPSFIQNQFVSRIILLIVSLLWLCSSANAQALSQAQRPRLGRISYTDLPNYDSVINLAHRGVDPSGQRPIDSVMLVVLQELSTTGTTIQFPSGTFLVNRSLRLPSNVILRGVHSDSTFLRFDLGGKGHSIIIAGTKALNESDLDSDASLGDQHIAIKADNFMPEELVLIRQNDSNWITSSWAKNSIGQIVKVKEIQNQNLLLESELRHDFFTSLGARICKPDFVRNTGVENLSIERLDETSSQTSNILFQYASNSWVYGVHLKNANFGHITFERSAFNLVTGCFFENGFSYGGGGKAYGLVLQHTSSENVIENNVFKNLRHSMLLQSGANGNILAYNYSFQPFWDGGFFPSNFAGDLVLHGNYVFANLFESNVVQNIVIDNSHGMNGPRNTFLRNRAEHAGIFMNSSQVSDSQHFIGNEITGEGNQVHNGFPFPKGMYSLAGKGHYEYGNNHNGTMVPNNIEELLESYYINASPEFWDSPNPWPCIGFPNALNSSKIPAQVRLESLKYTQARIIHSSKPELRKLIAKQAGPKEIKVSFELLGVLNSDRAIVEKLNSRNNQFELLGEAEQFSGSGSKEYTIRDYSPQPGQNHYRVRVVDSLNRQKTAMTVSAEYKTLGRVAVSKELGNNLFLVQGIDPLENVEYVLSNLEGKTVYSGTTKGTTNLVLDLSSHAFGVYVLSLRSKTVTYSYKLVVSTSVSN